MQSSLQNLTVLQGAGLCPVDAIGAVKKWVRLCRSVFGGSHRAAPPGLQG